MTVDRPAPAAAEKPGLPESAWAAAGLRFAKKQTEGAGPGWRGTPPGGWRVEAPGPPALSFRLAAGANGQVGVFPEQWPMAARMYRALARPSAGGPRSVLVLYAHTGAATLAALAAGARAVHVDAAAGAVARARANAADSGLAGLPARWIVDDARAFMARELRRGRTYDAVYADPPAFGRPPPGKGKGDWSLERHLPELLDLSRRLLAKEGVFWIMCCHAPGAAGQAAMDMVRGAARDWPARGGAWDRAPLALVSASGGAALRAGQAAVWEKYPCRSTGAGDNLR